MGKKSFDLTEKLDEMKEKKVKAAEEKAVIIEDGVPFLWTVKESRLDGTCQYLRSHRKNKVKKFNCAHPTAIYDYVTDIRYKVGGTTFTTKGVSLLSCKNCPQALKNRFLNFTRR